MARSACTRGWLPLVAVVGIMSACTPGAAAPPTVTATSATPISTGSLSSTSAGPTTTAMSDDEAAIAAVKRYFVEFNQALRSRTTAALRASHTDSCIPCAAESDNIDALSAAGRSVTGGEIDFKNIVIQQRISPTQLMFSGDMIQSPATVRDQSGKTVESFPSIGPKKAYVTVRLQGNAWKVSGLSA